MYITAYSSISTLTFGSSSSLSVISGTLAAAFLRPTKRLFFAAGSLAMTRAGDLGLRPLPVPPLVCFSVVFTLLVAEDRCDANDSLNRFLPTLPAPTVLPLLSEWLGSSHSGSGAVDICCCSDERCCCCCCCCTNENRSSADCCERLKICGDGGLRFSGRTTPTTVKLLF